MCRVRLLNWVITGVVITNKCKITDELTVGCERAIFAALYCFAATLWSALVLRKFPPGNKLKTASSCELCLSPPPHRFSSPVHTTPQLTLRPPVTTSRTSIGGWPAQNLTLPRWNAGSRTSSATLQSRGRPHHFWSSKTTLPTTEILQKIENLHKNVHTNGWADYPSIWPAHRGNSWYIERYDIVLLDRVQGGSYAFSNHIQVDGLGLTHSNTWHYTASSCQDDA